MKNYNEFKYIYPPRPEYKILPEELDTISDEWIGQPKYNGDCVVLFTNGTESHVYTRHNEKYSKKFNFDVTSLSFLAPSWFVFVGEYLNPKKKMGEDGKLLTDRLVIFDCLVAEGKYLIGYQLWERIKILHSLFEPYSLTINGEGKLSGSEYMMQTDVPNLYIAATFCGNLRSIYNEIVKVDIYEGLVVKNSNAPLLYSFTEKNNELWQYKCRKPTKVYNF
ncbi:MAG: ATP-dependent DNA ligase [Flavobacterium sp.]|nr:ATP-dependent DNA ligase [Flavobacterium sp.]